MNIEEAKRLMGIELDSEERKVYCDEACRIVAEYVENKRLHKNQ